MKICKLATSQGLQLDAAAPLNRPFLGRRVKIRRQAEDRDPESPAVVALSHVRFESFRDSVACRKYR